MGPILVYMDRYVPYPTACCHTMPYMHMQPYNAMYQPYIHCMLHSMYMVWYGMVW